MKRIEGRFGMGMLVGVVLLMAMFSIATAPTSVEAAIVAEWTPASPLGDARSQAVVVQDESGLVYLIGGVDSIGYAVIDNASSYDPDTGQWQNLAPLPHATRGAAGAYFDGKIYVFGGYNSAVGYLDYTQIYEIATDSWSAGAAVPQAVWEAKAGVDNNGLIYIFGGETSGVSFSNLVSIYDTASDGWTSGVNMPEGVKAGAVVYVGYYFLYIGGYTVTGATDAVRLYYTWGSWDNRAPLPGAAAGLAAVKGADSLAYAFGGGLSDANVEGAYSWTYYYNAWEDSWYDGPNLTVQSKYLGGAATNDGRILAIGGNNATAVHSSVDSMRIMSVSTAVAPTTVPTGRSALVTVSVEFANVVPEYFYSSAALVSESNASYGLGSFSGIFDMTFGFQIDIPEGISAGAYTLVLPHTEIDYSVGYTTLAEQKLSLAVVVGDTLDQQIESLQNEIADLQTRLAQSNGTVTALVAQIQVLLGALEGLQEQVDRLETKANNASTFGMINIVLVVIVVVLVALMLMMSRRKPKP